MICLLSPMAFVFCYQVNMAYVMAWYIQKPMTCIEVIDDTEYVRPYFMIDKDNHEFYACGHAIEVLGTYR